MAVADGHPTGAQAGGVRRALTHVAIRLGVLGVGAVVLANVHIPYRPATLCALRALTGVPCPICGTTTAMVELGHLQVLQGLAANPFTVVAIGLVVFSPGLPIGRLWDTKLNNTSRALLCVALLTAAELWQLVRFGLLP